MCTDIQVDFVKRITKDSGVPVATLPPIEDVDKIT